MRSGISYKVFFIHLAFWVLYSISNAYLWETFDKNYNAATFYGLTRLPLKLFAVYVNYYLLVNFFFRKRYLVFFFLFLLNLGISGIVQTLVSAPGLFNYRSFTQYSLPIYSVVVVTAVLIIIRQFIAKVKESGQLEVEKVKTELNLLKAQLQPHFLFNTLNNIYSLTLNNSELAGRSILQLSGLLRYVIYESQAQQVELQKEISHLKNYLELEKMRFTKELEISFNIAGDIAGRKIPPVLLMPFLENAFKHASNRMGENIWITIDLIVKESNLYFTVENSVAHELKTQKGNPYSGIGLDNIKRRLSLLYGNYVLENEMRENYYHSFLKLPLNQET